MRDNISFQFLIMTNDAGETRGIDNLFPSGRRAKYNKKKCGRCGVTWVPGLPGWYVPNFGAYFDLDYYCPVCLVYYQNEYISKNEAIKSADEKMKDLREQYNAMPYESSRIFRSEDGELRLDAYFDGENITLEVMEKEFKDYKTRETDIEIIRSHKKRLSEEIEQQEKIKRDNRGGSGFNPQANT